MTKMTFFLFSITSYIAECRNICFKGPYKRRVHNYESSFVANFKKGKNIKSFEIMSRSDEF